MDEKTVVRTRDGVIENKDDDAYRKYIMQRNLLQDVKNLKAQINILESRLAKLEEKVS